MLAAREGERLTWELKSPRRQAQSDRGHFSLREVWCDFVGISCRFGGGPTRAH
jgi:hypothetical protein